MTPVTGLIPPIPSPLTDGRLDLRSLERIVEDISPHVSGMLVGGGVGEVASLSIDERVTLFEAVKRMLPEGLCLAVSIADNSLEHTRRLAEAAAEAGASLVVASCPGYYANDVGMLKAYFTTVSALAPIDLCLYDNPFSSHTTLSVADIAAIAACAPRMTHVKVTDLSPGKAAALKEATDLIVCAGDDAVLWEQIHDADAVMVAAPLIYPEECAALWNAVVNGEPEIARARYLELAPFLHASLGSSDYVAVIKAVIHHRGIIESPEVRLPLVDLAPRRLAAVIDAYEMRIRRPLEA
jgi:4-hydroxy-tetrahydrodipicolinate synthase